MAYENLLMPGTIGPVSLKNRVMWASHATNFAQSDGEVSEAQIHYFARRARGGVGMVVSELVQVATEVDSLKVTHRSLRADDQRFVPGLARLAKAVHDNGAKIGVQMSPGAGAQALGGPWHAEGDVRAASPSGVLALGVHEHAMNPRALSIDEVRRIVQLSGAAAHNIRTAGFDLIEIHAHGGYLIHQFLSPYFNKRTDEYGGSLDNRCRFLIEIVETVKEAAGPEVAVTVKWSVEDALPGGWDTEQSLALVKKLEAAGVDGFGVSSGVHGGRVPAAPPYFYPMGTFLPFADAVRAATRLPLYTSGRLDDPELAERVLQDGRLDFVQVCRGLIADPDWVQKIADGRREQIRPCLACNHCRHQLVMLKPITCTVNAEVGRTAETGAIAPAPVKRKVLVVGGGPAGMEAARTASQRGHDVTLCEKHGRLGGLLAVAGIHNERIEGFHHWLEAEVRAAPIDVRLHTEVTPELVDALNPDYVILATGGDFVRPEIPGIDRDNVFGVSDLLGLMRGGTLRKGFLMRALSPMARSFLTPSRIRQLLRGPYPIGATVAVIGGKFAGCSLALLLAHAGKLVTVIEESERYGDGLESNTLVGLDNEISSGRVRMLTSAKVVEIRRNGVVVAGKDQATELVKTATVLLGLDLLGGAGTLAESLSGRYGLRTIGDARSFERIPNAIAEGRAAAWEVP